MMHPRTFAAILAFGVSTSLAVEAEAQNLKYISTTTMDMGGALGAIMSMFGGGDPTVETTWISGMRHRKDTGQTSSIMDWSEGVMIHLDHEAKTFTRFTLEEMAAEMSAAMSQIEAASQPTPDAAPDAAPDEPPEVEIEVKFSSERPGRTERIAGYQAELVILTSEIIATPTESAQPDAESAGLAIVSELWMSTEFPEYQMMQQMQAEMVERFRETASAGAAGMMAGLTAFDPRMKDMMAKNMEALGEVEGIALRTRMHFVTVPPGVTLDRQKVVDEGGESLGGGASGAAKGGAAEAMRQALGGLFGGGRQSTPEPEPDEPPELAQSVFLRLNTEVSNAETVAISGDLFQPTPGYTEIPMETLFRR
jgi:hypothetical protein